MSSRPFRSAVKRIPISKTATIVFRLEVQVVAKGNAPSSTQAYQVEHLQGGQKWTLKVMHDRDSDYMVNVNAPGSVKAFTFKTYQRTCATDIQYQGKGNWLQKGRTETELIIGAEVTVPTDQLAPIPRSSWNFTSSEQMQSWYVALCRVCHSCAFIVQLIALADFYDVKPLLEKCIDALKYLPTVSNVEKLRIAVKFNSTELEASTLDEVIASFTKDDLRALLASDLKDLGEERYQKILSTCAFF